MDHQLISAHIVYVVRRSLTPQCRLATALGLSPAAFSDRMRGRTPWRLADIAALAAYWNLTPADIIGHDTTTTCQCPGSSHAAYPTVCSRPVDATSPRVYGAGAVCEECVAEQHVRRTSVLPRLGTDCGHEQCGALQRTVDMLEALRWPAPAILRRKGGAS